MKLASALSLFGTASLLALASGCASDHGHSSPEAAVASEEAITGTSVQYFRVVGRDMRKCAFPMCSGYFVSRVNFAQTKCIDGTWADRCYVSELDLGKLGLPPAQASKELGEAEAGNVILKAKFATKKYAPQVSGTILSVSAAWQAASQNAPTGAFYSVKDSGIVCFTTPCPTIHEAKLNSSVSANVTGLDLSASGLNSKQKSAVFASLDGDGVFVAGSNVVHPKAGPAGDGTDLKASAVYFAVKPQPGFCQADDECTMTDYPKSVSTKSDCYCRTCGDATDTVTAAENEADYTAVCSGVKMTCPAVKCMYREAKCVENVCTAVVPPPKGAFCGGIAGIQCPADFQCVLDGTYPDAGGQCVACPIPECAAPPDGCHYESETIPAGTCRTGCGKLVCTP